MPDERPQRRREYSGAGSTLGVAALVIIAVGVAIWYFEIRGGDDSGVPHEAGIGIVALPDTLNSTGKDPAARTGRAAPNFALRSPEGDKLTLSDMRGQYVLVNFWASWCGPCRAEAPELEALQNDAGGTLTVVGVNQQEAAPAAEKFRDEFALTYPIVLDRSGEVSDAFRVAHDIPVSFLVDPQGVIVEVYLGGLDGGEIDTLQRDYLSSAQQAPPVNPGG
jgi:thiol-disulfide isomerase/thioredoxin